MHICKYMYVCMCVWLYGCMHVCMYRHNFFLCKLIHIFMFAHLYLNKRTSAHVIIANAFYLLCTNSCENISYSEYNGEIGFERHHLVGWLVFDSRSVVFSLSAVSAPGALAVLLIFQVSRCDTSADLTRQQNPVSCIYTCIWMVLFFSILVGPKWENGFFHHLDSYLWAQENILSGRGKTFASFSPWLCLTTTFSWQWLCLALTFVRRWLFLLSSLHGRNR